MLKNVIFDCGGVVCAYDPQWLMRQYFVESEIPIVQEPIYRDWQSLDAGTADYDEYVRDTLAMLPEALREPCARFFEGWYQIMPPIEDVWAMIARLKARGYGVYLLSNAPTVYVDSIQRNYPIIRAMDGVVISAPLKMVKPNAEIFEYALNTYRLKAEECLFVDDIAVNVEGARRAGLNGFVFSGDVEPLWREIERLGGGREEAR